jgi:RluA family pseudouridine synthase
MNFKTMLEKHIVPENIEKIRLSDYAIGIFEALPTRKSVKKAIKKGQITVNGKVGKTGTWIFSEYEIVLLDLDVLLPKVFQFPLKVLYEDEFIAVIYKNGGLPTNGNYFKTVQNALPFNLLPSSQKDAFPFPIPVHRLDAATCGLLLIAKTRSAFAQLSQQFEEKIVFKRYEAVVFGTLPKEGEINLPINEKNAMTSFKVLKYGTTHQNIPLTWVNLFPKTGRTHQLRIHLSHLGNAIVGDKIYSDNSITVNKKGLMLCAVELKFIHPNLKIAQHFCIEPPKKFEMLFNKYS